MVSREGRANRIEKEVYKPGLAAKPVKSGHSTALMILLCGKALSIYEAQRAII